ncbi:MAG: hypothetical protein WCG63_02870 [Opitutaceae bacterium]
MPGQCARPACTTKDFCQGNCPPAETILTDGVVLSLNEEMNETDLAEVAKAIRTVAA